MTSKVAISMDPHLLAQADRLAGAAHRSRSGFIADLIRREARRALDRDITERLDRVYGDAQARKEHERMTREAYEGEVFGDEGST